MIATVNLSTKLLEREAAGKPVTVALIGAGKFGTMFLAQARLTKGLHVAAVADLDVARARSQLKTAGWPEAAYAAASLDDAHKQRATFVTDNADALIADPRIEVIVEATGVPGAGIHHCAESAIDNGKHIVMVNVEADAVAGPLAGAPRQGGRRRLFAGLGRPAGADLRACRLGARRRLQGDRSRQRHALRAALSPVQSGQCLGYPRQISQHHRPQVDQSENVQLVSSTAPSPASR